MSTPAGREEKVRDSGIAEISSSEDEEDIEVENPLGNIVEEEEEENEENLVINPQVIPPPEGFNMEGAGNPANPNNPADPGNLDGDANAGAAQAAAAAGLVLPGQLVTLPVFDGKRGEGFVNWLEAIENAQRTYNWAPNSLVQVAKTKGGPKIAEWDRGNRLRGNVRNIWEGPGNFRESLMLRFGPKYTSPTAVNAVCDLKKSSKESCAGFLDRVVLAINKQNFNIAEADKRTPQYLRVFDASIMSHFGAGLKDEIGKVVFGAATPPGTVEEMLQAAEAVEAELAKIGQPGTSALAVQEETPNPTEGDQLMDLTEAIEEICAAIGLKRRRPFDKSRSKCYNCYKFGHFQNECPEPRRQPFRGSNPSTETSGAPPARRSTAPRRRWNQNAVDECPEAQPKEDQQETHHSYSLKLGNYQGRPE